MDYVDYGLHESFIFRVIRNPRNPCLKKVISRFLHPSFPVFWKENFNPVVFLYFLCTPKGGNQNTS